MSGNLRREADHFLSGYLVPGLVSSAGKPWGQLPGELRNQILQDMKARYGEDYARIIKLYFEQIAETKEQKK